jgi:hypothetical protein
MPPTTPKSGEEDLSSVSLSESESTGAFVSAEQGTGEEAELDEEDSEGIEVDLGSVDEMGNFRALPGGIYDVELVQLDYGQSQRSGNNMWTAQLSVMNGDYKDSKFFYHLVFTEGGLPRVKRFLARLHCEDNAAQKLLSGRFKPERVSDEGTLLGGRGRVRVDIRKYQGQKRNNVRDFLAPAKEGFAAA